MLAILSGPIQFVRKKREELGGRLLEPTVFMAMTSVCTFASQLAMVEKYREEPLASFSTFLFVKFINVFLDLALLKFCWRIVGGKASLASLYTTSAYIFIPNLIIAYVIFFSSIGLAMQLDPSVTTDIKSFRILAEQSEGVGTIFRFGVIAAILAPTLYVAMIWGVFADINFVPQWRSWTAFVLYTILGFPLLYFQSLITFAVMKDLFQK